MQQHNLLNSVSARIAEHVLDFCEKTIKTNSAEFHAADLRAYVEEREPNIAPGSPDRILRRLRADNKLNYTVVNRAKSLYRMDWIIRGFVAIA